MKEYIENTELGEGVALVVGISASLNEKTGKVGTVLSYLQNYESWKRERAKRCEGFQAISEYTSMDCSDLQIGDKVRFVYRKGFKDRAELAGYTFVE